MLVEILSPSSAKRDLNEKFDLYEASGVKEYWIVYPLDREIHVFLLQETGKYGESIVFERKGQIPVHIFDGHPIDLEEIFC
jgi:Uma2 family endonuclease